MHCESGGFLVLANILVSLTQTYPPHTFLFSNVTCMSHVVSIISCCILQKITLNYSMFSFSTMKTREIQSKAIPIF